MVVYLRTGLCCFCCVRCAGVFTPGKADRCVTSALSYINDAPQPDPLEYNILLADVGDKP